MKIIIRKHAVKLFAFYFGINSAKNPHYPAMTDHKTLKITLQNEAVLTVTKPLILLQLLKKSDLKQGHLIKKFILHELIRFMPFQYNFICCTQ